MTENSLPQTRPSDIDVFMAAPAKPQAVTPAFMVGVFMNLLAKDTSIEPRLRDRWLQSLAHWQRMAAADAEVQREGWAAVKQSLGMDDGVRR